MKLILAFLIAGLLSPADTISVVDASAYIRPEYQPLARGLSITPAFVPTAGNHLTIIPDGSLHRNLLFPDLESAKKNIEIECLLFSNTQTGEEVVQLLSRKNGEGVEVKYIHEGLGNFFDNIFDGEPVFSGFFDNMNKRGISKRDFAPLYRLWWTFYYPSHRNHRKITTIDDDLVYTGGMNYSTQSLSDWKDMHVRIQGPCAPCFRAIFMDTWNTLAFDRKKEVELNLSVVEDPSANHDGTIVQAVADGVDQPARMAQNALIWILDNAERYVWMRTPYLCPTTPLIKAMKRAAARGIDVCILIPEISDMKMCEPVNHHYAAALAKAGVRVQIIPNEFNHAKVFIADDYLSCIGSTNLDKLSLKRLYEVNTYIYDEDTALELKALFDKDLAGSYLVTPEFSKNWSLGEHISQAFWVPLDFLL